jgi:hypothetical protein
MNSSEKEGRFTLRTNTRSGRSPRRASLYLSSSSPVQVAAVKSYLHRYTTSLFRGVIIIGKRANFNTYPWTRSPSFSKLPKWVTHVNCVSLTPKSFSRATTHSANRIRLSTPLLLAVGRPSERMGSTERTTYVVSCRLVITGRKQSRKYFSVSICCFWNSLSVSECEGGKRERCPLKSLPRQYTDPLPEDQN